MAFTLYNYYRSSASYRVRIALNLKGIAYEYKPVHLLEGGGQQHQAEYKKLNPSREVPTLVHNGKAIGQSVAIMRYLDDISPAKPLFPKDPYFAARVLQACEIVNSGTQPLVNLRVLQELERRYGVTDQAKKNEWAQHWSAYGLAALESFLAESAGPYCFGSEVTAADCFLVPQIFTSTRFHTDFAPYPIINRIYQACIELDAFKRAAPESQPDTPKA